MTTITKRLAKIKEKPDSQKFKQDVLDFLKKTNASKEITYHLLKDLSTMISMPFYKEPNFGVKNRRLMVEVVKEYCALSITYVKTTGDIDFIRALFKWLSLNQAQALRRLSRLRQKQKNIKKQYLLKGIAGVYEHPIPVKYTRELLLDYIAQENYEDCVGYIDFVYESTFQIFLCEDFNKRVSSLYNDSMPNSWCWKDKNNNNPYQRYIDVGIFEKIIF